MMSLLNYYPTLLVGFFYAIILKKIGQFMTGLRNFYDLIEKCGDCSKSLLLGNGFSISCNRIFQYENLFNESNLPNNIKKLFNGGSDYEKVIEYLNKRKEMHQANDEYEFVQMFEDWIYNIKWDLISTITEIHSRVKTNKKNRHNTFLFLSNFSNIFTLNYDLLLYWVVVYAVKLKEKNLQTYKECIKNKRFYPSDGFVRVDNDEDCIWYQYNYKQNIFYLHGGLHLFYDNVNIFKLTYNVNNNQTIINKTKYWLEQGTSPLIITEGNIKDKLKWIKQNTYLNYCYQQLGLIKDVLFIHGHSLDYNDEHIFKAINANPNINAVYISIFDPVINEEIIRQKAYDLFAERINDKSLIVDFYNAQSVALW